MVLVVQKTPTLTTATAWSKAETGVGATMAPGSQWWKGMTPFLAKPKRQKTIEHDHQDPPWASTVSGRKMPVRYCRESQGCR
jgi:hypothetical protein